MFLAIRACIFRLRWLIWIPFQLLSHGAVYFLALATLAVVSHRAGEPPGAIFPYALLLIALWVALRVLARLLHPGQRPPPRPGRAAKPLPPAQATPASTRTGSSPNEPEVMVRLPIALQHFLAEERTAPKAAE